MHTYPLGRNAQDPQDPQTSTARMRSLLEFPGRWLIDLPEPVVLHLRVAGAPVPVSFVTHATASCGEAPVLAASISYLPDELHALVLGVEADRIWHREFLGFCFEKWRRPTFRLSVAEALDGANPDHEQPAWSCERILQRLQARVAGFEIVAQARPLPGLRVAA
jgi:hypothetical protein